MVSMLPMNVQSMLGGMPQRAPLPMGRTQPATDTLYRRMPDTGPMVTDPAQAALLRQQAEARMVGGQSPQVNGPIPGIMPQFTDQLQTGAVAQSGTIPMQQPQMSGPPTGLIGSEAALQGGAEAALAGLMGGYGQAQGILSGPGTAAPTASYSMGGVTGALNPFTQPGGQAINLQAALSGALGAPAQQQAYANYQESPGQQYLREQSERALLRNSAAIGGLGGGRVRQELQRQAQGLALQDFDNSFARLGSVAQLGATAAGQQAGIAGNLEGQRMGVQGNIDTQAMQNENARRLALANLASQTGTNAADLAYRTGQSVAGNRFQVGQDIAGSVGGTISALANLANQQGQDIAGTIGQGAGNLADIIAAAGGQQGASQQNLATILANIASGQGSQVGALPGIPGSQQVQGILGNLGNAATGTAALMAASDIRLKENIQYIGKTPTGINLYTWDWNADGRAVTGEETGFGVIAQEIEKVIPDAVIRGADGWLRVNYGALANV